MRRVITAITVAASASALFLAAPQLASAAAPSNDTSAGATVVSALPYNQTEDTTQATTDAEDAALNANCGAPATEASVWFTYTSPTDDTLIADVSASNYSAGLIVATGTPGNLSIQDCGPQELVESISAGQQLYFMAFDDTVGNGVGGTLQISISSAPPPPSFTVTVNSVGHFNSRTGVATISGTSTCTGGDSIDIETDLRQRVGRLVITGTGFTDLPCDGTYHWSIDVTGDNGRFGGGRVSVVESSFACGVVDCSNDTMTKTVQLKK